MRTDYCRQHIEQAAKGCGLERTTVEDVNRAIKFVEQYPAMADCSTHAINTLMRVKDDEVKEAAIRIVVSALDKSNPNGKEREESLTGTQIKALISRAELEVSTRREKTQKEEVKSAEVALESVNVEISTIEEPLKPIDTAELDRLSEVLKGIQARADSDAKILAAAQQKVDAIEETVSVMRSELRDAESRARNIRGYRDAVKDGIRLSQDLLVHVARQIKAIREGRDPRTKEERAWLKRHEAEEAKHAEVLKQMYELMIRGI